MILQPKRSCDSDSVIIPDMLLKMATSRSPSLSFYQETTHSYNRIFFFSLGNISIWGILGNVSDSQQYMESSQCSCMSSSGNRAAVSSVLLWMRTTFTTNTISRAFGRIITAKECLLMLSILNDWNYWKVSISLKLFKCPKWQMGAIFKSI